MADNQIPVGGARHFEISADACGGKSLEAALAVVRVLVEDYEATLLGYNVGFDGESAFSVSLPGSLPGSLPAPPRQEFDVHRGAFGQQGASFC